MIAGNKKTGNAFKLMFAAWTGLALYHSNQVLVERAFNNAPLNWLTVVRVNFLYCYLWFAFTPLVLWFGRHYKLDKPHRKRNVLIHFLLGIAVSLLHLALLSTLNCAYSSESLAVFYDRFIANYKSYLATDLSYCILLYWVIIITGYAFTYYEAYRKETLKAAQLETSLALSKLETLKAQLHPHFLFNSLNSITALVLKKENKNAVRMINRLSELLRLTLNQDNSFAVELSQEIDFIKRYLEIEQIRFQDRLSVSFNIEPEALSVKVPPMILQPIVENAVRHAVAPHSTAGRIEISASIKEEKLYIEISDDGPGVRANQSARAGGVGLENTRKRLSQLYEEHFTFELCNKPEKGAVARFCLPLETCETISSN